ASMSAGAAPGMEIHRTLARVTYPLMARAPTRKSSKREFDESAYGVRGGDSSATPSRERCAKSAATRALRLRARAAGVELRLQRTGSRRGNQGAAVDPTAPHEERANRLPRAVRRKNHEREESPE